MPRYKKKSDYNWGGLNASLIKACELAATKASRLWGVEADDMFQEALIWCAARTGIKQLDAEKRGVGVISHYIYRQALRDKCARSTWRGVSAVPTDKHRLAIPADPSMFQSTNEEGKD